MREGQLLNLCVNLWSLKHWLNKFFYSFLVLVFLDPAEAYEVRGKQYDTVIIISGEINEATVIDFENQVRTAQGETLVELSGPGGLVAPALQIGNRIRKLGFSTIVPAGKQCASACVLIWFSGQERYMSRFGRLLVHSVYVRDRSGKAYRSFDGNNDVAEHLRRMNVPEDLIYYTATGDPDGYFPLTPRIGRAMGLRFHEF
jgi:hypothetical protein